MAKVLDVYDEDLGFIPVPNEGDPPSEEKDRQRLTRDEAKVEWRHKVEKCLRIKDRLYPHEIPWRRRYMDWGEARAFWRWRKQGISSPNGERAVKKVFYLMKSAKLLLE